MNRMSRKESIVSGRIRIRRELAACLICVSLLVFTGTLFAEPSDDPYDEDYEGDNKFCQYDNTMIQQVSTVCTQAIYLDLTSTGWGNKLRDMTEVAQIVNAETYWWATMPFDSVTEKGSNLTLTPWSDTWGVCAYFESIGFVPYGIPTIVEDPEDLMSVLYLLVNNLAPDPHCWMVALVTGFGNYFGPITAYTEMSTKASIIAYNQSSRTFVHEYGHTSIHRVTTDDRYGWPDFGDVEFGIYGDPDLCEPRHFNMNVMFYGSAKGNDADAAYKNISFPFYYNDPYHSYRYDAQWD